MNEEVIFTAALEMKSTDERAAYLDEACTGRVDLRRKVEELLVAHGRAGDFLDEAAAALKAHLVIGDVPQSAEQPGTMIGPYKLLEQIGEGGMGLVFMAEQTRPVRRLVALKILKPGMDTRQIVARFEQERQALALMDHPNIAKMFDAGTVASGQCSVVSKDKGAGSGPTTDHWPLTTVGRPYFVMELVRGVPITEFCDQRRLTTRQRLELFVIVCQAVQHAHQKGIIHRDLKPSNVLVTLHDTIAVPKIIDFGIAKAMTQSLTERTLFTHFAQMIGTPLYMSPEQAEMNGLDVDTRSDVYSLGVLLYELLTGLTPFAGETLRRAGLDEMRRMIREEEPPTPSQRLSTLDARACSTVSERRGVDGRRLGQVLRGELDWIVMRALEKDRNRRYESASAFAADVQRYLSDEAVAACPPSAGYRLRKYVRRNRRVLVMAGVVAASLVVATAVSTWQAVVARDAQQQAEADRKQAEADRKQAEADRDRARSAENQAKNDQNRAKAAERRAATEAAIARAVNDFLQGDLLRQVGSMPYPGEEFGENPYLTVREALDRASARIGQRFRDQPLIEAAIRMAIGQAYASLHAHQIALSHSERAVALRKAHLGPDHPDTLSSMQHLANVYISVGCYADAIALRQRILENLKARLGPNHPETLAGVIGLAEALRAAGQWDKSVPLVEHVLEKQRTVCGPTHSDTIRTMQILAINYSDVDRLEESMILHQQILEGLKSQNGLASPYGTWCIRTFAQVCQRAGKLDRADKLLREALELDRNQENSQVQRNATANTLGWLALNLSLQQRYDAAEPFAREAVAMNQNEEKRRFQWVSLLGAILLGQQKYAEAEPLLLQGYEGMKQRKKTLFAGEKSLLTEAGERVVHFYEVTNQPEKAREWREKLGARKKPEKND